MNQLPTHKRAAILRLLLEGVGMRPATRVLGISLPTVNKLLIDAGSACAWWHDNNVRDVAAGHVQCDEIWSFVYAKQKKVPFITGSPDHAGHTWTWTALDIDSKLMLSWLTSAARDYESAFELMRDLASRMKSCRVLSSDGLYSYEPAVEDIFGRDQIDFGMMVKPNTTDSPHDDNTYNRPRPIKKAIFGEPESIGTSFVERSNLTLRMGNRRFNRKTNAHSKSLDNHRHSLALFYTHYNWCRPHMSLSGRTPAMASGLATEPYPVEWIVDLVDSRAPKPNRPKYYNTKRQTVEDGVLVLRGTPAPEFG